ncbi:uncharacterized protein BCR38DRAFT_438845 [Pseudomassariella vexata]|uniref:Uncharacterized protein n=1 Tax=Pseudomassariella vexata TaxID=1141098 RepID=A0A1Y2DTL8_9PEZI|nr:uncharacterized protein BCR38DRAFT_438845 [Pseudomassariella vexata]ORY62494.1 hypothetical protein BCR38DRAFT_438845 [Pseudomassariella vexata]
MDLLHLLPMAIIMFLSYIWPSLAYWHLLGCQITAVPVVILRRAINILPPCHDEPLAPALEPSSQKSLTSQRD